MRVAGAFVGVVGADITLLHFERALLPALADGMLVLTAEGRVAASADPDVVVQRLMRADALRDYRVQPVPGTPFAVAQPTGLRGGPRGLGAR